VRIHDLVADVEHLSLPFPTVHTITPTRGTPPARAKKYT
jgi:hypothetical protein